MQINRVRIIQIWPVLYSCWVWSEAENFFEKIKNEGPNIHYFAIKIYTGASKLHSLASKSVGWGLGPLGPPWIC